MSRSGSVLGCAAITLFSIARLASQGVCHLASGSACTTVAPPVIKSPAGMGQYCSVTWSTGGWSFTSSGDLTGDPCKYIITHGGPGGVIRRSGMYSLSGINNVVERCSDGRIMLFGGAGGTPLNSAFKDAQGHPGCVFNVSPRSFGGFNAPFSLSPLPAGYTHGTGVDLARDPYKSVDLLNDFKEPSGLTQAFIVDYQGNQRDGSPATKITAASSGQKLPTANINVTSTSAFSPSPNKLSVATTNSGAQIVTCAGKTTTSFTGCTGGTGTLATGGPVLATWGFINDHQGHDFVMNDGTQIRAVADGIVDMARFRDVTNACGAANGTQGEIYIRHRFSGGKAEYDEWYESYYAHLETLAVSTGQIVHEGDPIGLSGHSGCTGGRSHLHMSVFRLTNTASALSYPLVINTDFSPGKDQNSDFGWQIIIEPYGFFAPTTSAFDPWAWRAYTSTGGCYLWGGVSTPCNWGAQSVDLWTSGQTPPLSPFNGWPVIW